MPKNDDLSFKPSRGPEQRDHEACQELQTIDHPAADYPIRGRKPLRIKFSVGTMDADRMIRTERQRWTRFLSIRIMIFARMAPAGRRRVLDSDAVNGWLVGDTGR